MFTFLLFLAIIYLFYQLFTLSSKLENLKTQLDQLKLSYLQTSSPTLQTLPHTNTTDPRLDQRLPLSPSLAPKPPIESHTSQSSPEFNQPLPSPEITTRFFSWFAIDWPLKVGAIFIILAITWFITYAFLNNWIGPYGRILLGFSAGSLIMIFGHRWLARSRHQGLVLELLGASLTLITIFAAQNTYHMFPTSASIVFSVAVMFFLAFSSLTYQDRWLALSGLIVGALAPILTGSTEADIVGLYSYLLALCAGTLWLARYKQWNFLTPTALAIVTFYSLEYLTNDSLLKYSTPLEILQLRFFATTFTALFFGSNIYSLITQKQPRTAHIITALSIGIFTLGWINALTPEHLQSLITLTAALIFAIAAQAIYRQTQNPTPVYIYTGTATLLLTVATSYQFEGPSLVIAFTCLATFLPILYLRLLGPKFGIALFLYFLLPMMLSFPSFTSNAWDKPHIVDPYFNYNYIQQQQPAKSPIFHSDFAALLALTTGLWIAGLYLYSNNQTIKSQLTDSQQLPPEQFHTLTNTILILASLYTLALIWKVSHAAIDTQYLARFLTLTIYTLVGLYTYFRGQTLNRPVLRRYGMYLTLAVIAWLVIIEVWNMKLAGRIITFLTLGILLITSVLIRRKPTH